MSQALREIRLYGRLGAEFGRVFHLAVSSPAEAVRALCAVLPGFRAAFLGDDGQAEYFVRLGRGRGRQTIDETRKDELVDPAAAICFVPALGGAKKQGAGQTILGAILVVVGVVVNAWTSGTAGNPFIQAGVGMMVSGVVQMLAPQRKTDKATNDPSYGMDAGAVNTADAGDPVPLAYGRVIAGSLQASAGLATDQVLTWYSMGGSGEFPELDLPYYMSRFYVDSGNLAWRWSDINNG